MKKKEQGNAIAYQSDDATVYLVTAINPVAGILGASNLPENAKEDLDYIWEDSGATKLILFIPAEATDFIATARKLGFKQEGRLKKATPEGDLLVFGQYR